MAETLKTIEKRKSTREFKSDQIPADAVDTILKAGEQAPIGCAAFDAIHFTVVQDKALIDKIASAASNGERDVFYGAPTVIIVSSGSQPFPGLDLADAGSIVQNFLLAATDIGIDSVYIYSANAAFAADPSLLAAAGIPDGFKPVSSVALGYGTDDAVATPKAPRSIKVNRIS
ncbi:MAG: nitroreductase family protein [Clostridiales Family XIII bacterium]|jgi:nitroreductase|nr:nitroreductase family protein [Clostridiales Family XIII bacterium]